MQLEEMIVQCALDSARWFPSTQSIPFLTLCLAGEVGEVANIVKKVERGTLPLNDALPDLQVEIIDVLIYLCNLLGHESFDDVDWQQVWDRKRAYNEGRFGNFQAACGMVPCEHAPDGVNHPIASGDSCA